MKKVWLIMAVLLLLAGCGGGGGSGGSNDTPLNVDTDNAGGWPVASIEPNTTINGSLRSSDIHAPDGTFADLYSITLPSDTTLTVRLESGDFDSYLYLFEEAALDEPNIDNWFAYHWLAENDDVGDSYNSEFSISLAAGTYLIVANSWDIGETGAYRLTASTPAPATGEGQTISATPTHYVHYRSYEDPAANSYMGWVDFTKAGQLIEESDVSSIKLFDPSGVELLPTVPPQFLTTNYVITSWNPVTLQFEQTSNGGFSGFLFYLSDYADLQPGTFTFQVQEAGGHSFNVEADVPSLPVLPVIDSSTMQSTWEADGSLTLSWAVPDGTWSQTRVYFTTQEGNAIFYGRTPPWVGEVNIPAYLVQQISDVAQLTQPTSINWSMQTREYTSTAINYARGISDPLPISWSAP